MRRWMYAVVVLAGACAGDSSSSGGAPDAAIDARPAPPLNPPLQCPTTVLDPCTEPLPALAGTWKFSPSSTQMTQMITFAPTADPAVLTGTTAGATVQMMHLFDGDWHIEPTDAWRCYSNGTARTLSWICKRPNGDLQIGGDTRVPGFHTAYETTEFYVGVLVP